MKKNLKNFESLVIKFIERFWVTELKAITAMLVFITPLITGYTIIRLFDSEISKEVIRYLFIANLFINSVFYCVTWIALSKKSKKGNIEYDDNLERNIFWATFLFFVYVVLLIILVINIIKH